MRETVLRHRLTFFAVHAAIFACALALASCGSSGETFTSPTALTKCAVAFAPSASNIPAAGGTASITVNTERECQWTAASDAGWLSIKSGNAGQGPGTVQFAAAANADPVARSGSLVVNDGHVPVTQAAGECSFQLAQPSASFPQAGGAGSVGLSASSALCQWSAKPNVDWIALASPANGKGSASVAFTVAPTTGPPRNGTLTIAGLSFTVIQSAGCTFAIAPTTASASSAGGSQTVSVSAGAGCPWTAQSNVSWITVASGASGSGNGAVVLTVASTAGPGRSGTVTIAGQTFTLNQGQGCTFALSSGSAAAPAAGANGSFEVRTDSGCGWTAASSADWLHVVAGATGNGPGTVQYSVAANTGPPRSAAISAGGQPFTVAQDAGCSFAIAPATHNSPSGGETTSAAVTAPDGCSWSASSNASWIGIASGQNGSGNGTVQLVVAPNTGSDRTGTVTIAMQPFTIVEASGCSATVSPDTIAQPAAGGTQTVGVTTDASCAWTAVSNAPWITFPGAAGGAGNASVPLAIEANSGAPRTGTATVAGHTVTVNQDGGCTFTISPASQDVAQGGGSGTVGVTTDASCAWTAVSGASWITVTAGGSGSGAGSVQFTVDVNAAGAPRSGTIAIAGQTFTVNQAGSQDSDGSIPSSSV